MTAVTFPNRTLFRLAGLSAIAGAVLRVIAASPSLPLTAQAAESLYVGIDALLLIGFLGIFCDADRLRRATGGAGFVVVIAGFLLIRTGPRVGALGEFQAAAAVLALGLTIVGAAALQERGLLRWMGAMWVASFVAGLAGAITHVAAAFLVAVLLFCAGFVIAGVRLLRGPHAPQ